MPLVNIRLHDNVGTGLPLGAVQSILVLLLSSETVTLRGDVTKFSSRSVDNYVVMIFVTCYVTMVTHKLLIVWLN